MAKATFFFDLGPKRGMGHLRRCEALAAELAGRGWQVAGFCRDTDPGKDPTRDLAIDPRFPVSVRKPDLRADLVVVDSYLQPATAGLRSGGARLATYLDWPQANPSDLIVDCNLGADPGAYAADGCPGRVLAGPDYFPVRVALLKPAATSRGRDRSGPVRRLLVTFGGSALRQLAERTVGELAAAGSALEIRVLVGTLANPGNRLREAIRRLPRASLVSVGAGCDLGEHFAWADLAVSAAGLTKYELALFGVPAIILSIGDDQDKVAGKFAKAGTVRYLGRLEKLDPGAIGTAVSELAADGDARRLMCDAGRALVDGRGAARIADEIERLMENRG
ncbi:MAG TPA: hypothetical protein PK280_16760 [Planctomycetota bacterium]|nr:hypothetical protein [Planctomycetota bacterium]